VRFKNAKIFCRPRLSYYAARQFVPNLMEMPVNTHSEINREDVRREMRRLIVHSSFAV
jgi:hypothetical protein